MAKPHSGAERNSDASHASSHGTGSDAGARNMLFLVIFAVGSLVCFILYLVHMSVYDAAPFVNAPAVVSENVSAFVSLNAEPARSARKGASHQSVDGGSGASPTKPAAEPADGNDGDAAPPKRVWDPGVVARGQLLYRTAGCGLCHGRKGQGGVTNPNYTKDTFPPLSNMATKLSLEFPEDVDVVIDMLVQGQSPDDPTKLDIPDTAGVVAAKYKIVSKVMHDGNPAAKKSPEKPEPIFMPAYKDVLSDEQMNQIITSFLIMYPIEEETWESEAEK